MIAGTEGARSGSGPSGGERGSFVLERPAFEAELNECYGRYPASTADLEQRLHAESAAHLEWSPYRRKVHGYARIAEECLVHIFRHSPFYYELNSGAERHDLGSAGIGT